MHDRSDVRLATHLFNRHALTPTEVARLTGIPRRTLQDWRTGRFPGKGHGGLGRECHIAPCTIDLGQFDPDAYCYLLGLYLGDGCISQYGRAVRLRIVLDSQYPGIIQECVAAMDGVARAKKPRVYKRPTSNCVEVGVYWRHWPCVFPQHGAGRKHLRPIVLTDKQQNLVSDLAKAFLRGLIHSDGTRIIAVERKGNSVRRVPRYAFSNMSKDILGLFAQACEQVGVQYTQPSYKQIAIYRKTSVALMDEFVGPKY